MKLIPQQDQKKYLWGFYLLFPELFFWCSGDSKTNGKLGGGGGVIGTAGPKLGRGNFD